MQVECVKEKLQEAVSKVVRVTGKHASLPALSHILIIAAKNKIVLRATNLDVGVEFEINAKVKEEGEVAVPGSMFSQLIGNLPNEKNVVLSKRKEHIHIKTESSETTVQSANVEDFPTLPIVNDGNGFDIDTQIIIQGIRSVVYSASTSDIKPELSSVYIYTLESSIVFVATDSFRLAEKKIQVKNISSIPGILIPFKNANEIASILDGVSGDVSVRFSETQIALSTEDVYITSRLVDAVFPDYRQIIPKEEKTEATILKQDLVNVLKINTIFANKFNQVFFRVYPSKKMFAIETKNQNLGENIMYIDSSLSGEDVDISLNYKYITEALPSIKTDSITLSFHGPNKPVVVKGVSDTSFQYLVMPMNR